MQAFVRRPVYAELRKEFGAATQNAVWAFQRVNGLLPDAIVGDKTTAALADPKPPVPMRPDGPPNRVEVSVKNQLLIAYRDGVPLVITHISSGSEIAFCENGICGDAVNRQVPPHRVRRASDRKSRCGRALRWHSGLHRRGGG